MRSQTLWESSRRSLREAIHETATILSVYGPRYRHWCIAYSGGKDSTALVTVIAFLVKTRVFNDLKLSIRYADTRMELPPLKTAADAMIERLNREGFDAQTVLPAMDERFFVYMLGRGVPPPSNTFRWCTDQLKIEPMEASLASLCPGEKVLMLTGVRLGESAARDDRIAATCSKDGAECGQGRLHLSMAGSKDSDINQLFIPGADADPCDTLAPILTWRVCHVWDWLLGQGEAPLEHSFEDITELVADAYGDGNGSQLIENAARTGCVGCNLASRDVALDRLCQRPEWSHLEPLKRLRHIYATLKQPRNRLRKPGGETRKDGSLCANQNRMGPLTFEAREWALAMVKTIQEQVSSVSPYSLINADEEQRIRDLIAARTWPDGWDGTEPRADEDFEEWRPDGSRQPSLFSGR